MLTHLDPGCAFAAIMMSIGLFAIVGGTVLNKW